MVSRTLEDGGPLLKLVPRPDTLGPHAQLVYADLRQRVLSGELPTGAQLPSQPELARVYGVALMTVRRALDRLEAEGLLEARAGRGTFVTGPGRKRGWHDSPPNGRRSQGETEGLRRNEADIRRLIIDMHVGVIIHGPNAEILATNPAALQLIGLTEEELVHKAPTDPGWAVLREDGTPFPLEERPAHRAITTGRPVRGVIMGIHRPRTRDHAWLLTNAEPQLAADGRLERVIVTFMDVTERRQIEQALRASEDRYRSVVESILDGVAVTDPAGIFTFANGRLAHMLGFDSPDRLNGRRVRDFVIVEEWELVRLELRAALQQGAAGRACGCTFVRVDGTTFPAEISGSLVKDDHGNVVAITGVIRDVTERKRADERLRAAERKYRELVEQLPVAIYLESLDEATPTKYIGPEIEAMLGYPQREWLDDLDFWRKILHPDDRERAVAEHHSHLEAGERFTMEYRFIARDGRVVWVRDVAILVRDEATGEVMQHGVIIDVTERKMAEEALAYQAAHDTLTDLPNRIVLQDRLQHSIEAARQTSTPCALLLMDLDRFKEINDTFGHHWGDLLLQRVSSRLQGTIRASDTVARLGGDEFAIILPGTDLAGAVQAAGKLMAALEAPFVFDDRHFNVGASIGIALYPNHADEAEGLLRRADVAMYTAKNANSGYSIYAADRDPYSPLRLSLTTALQTAIEAGELLVHYQPKMHVTSGQFDGVEALVRWDHPQHGLIPPNDFIPLAERSGLIRPLTRRVLKQSIAGLRAPARGWLRSRDRSQPLSSSAPRPRPPGDRWTAAG